jgi:NADPH:quinone reductase-like Zn-dependent oxidoreductase
MLIIQIPDGMPDEDACTLGVGITTVGQGLYQSLGLPLPGSRARANFPILIYGGSTATGSLAIQYARLSGCSQIITTCSPRHFDWVESLGADASFDYRDPDCVQKIKDCTQNTLAHVLDCVSTSASAELCAAAIGSNGGTVSYLLPLKHQREDVEAKYTLAYTAFGEYFSIAGTRKFEARPEDLEFAKIFWKLSEGLVAEGKIRVHPPRVGKDGLKGVLNGFQAMREGRVSGEKLVYRIEDTP